MRPKANPVAHLGFYATRPHPCGYLPGLQASSLVADPSARLTTEVYSQLVDYGFRRSGEHVYRPHCLACNACIPVRLAVADFKPRRVQRRTWTYNTDLNVIRRPADYDPEHFALYRHYISRRHSGGGMDNLDRHQYLEFLTASWCDTVFYEFRLGQRLLAVAVVDHLLQGLSAVYTFFHPDEQARSLGTYAVLWEIEETRRLGLAFLYLGYWIKDCPKMRYKSAFGPLQIYRDGRWQEVPPE
jgi:arginine-tRNA-protein transferase